MKRNMKQWVNDLIANEKKPPIPVLSFPCVQLLGITVKELISDSNLQAKGMKAVADRIPSGAAVSLMDLSVEAECFGSTIRVSDHEVPTVIGAVVKSAEDAEVLAVPPVGTARSGLYIKAIEEAVTLIRDRPVFAGVIGPFSLAGRLADVSEIMILCYDDPDMVHTLMEKATEFVINYCKAYKEAGANGVMIAEPLAGLMSPNLAQEFAHTYVKQVIDAVQDESFAVIYHNCGDNVDLMAKDIYEIGAAGYHFGDAIRLADMLPTAPKDALVMGNVSPSKVFRNGTPESTESAVRQIMEECSGYPNFLISSGCDIPPMTPWENIDAFFNAVTKIYE